ncbi:hypothetical protein FQZ97_780640 [compost metagenome]
MERSLGALDLLTVVVEPHTPHLLAQMTSRIAKIEQFDVVGLEAWWINQHLDRLKPLLGACLQVVFRQQPARLAEQLARQRLQFCGKQLLHRFRREDASLQIFIHALGQQGVCKPLVDLAQSPKLADPPLHFGPARIDAASDLNECPFGRLQVLPGHRAVPMDLRNLIFKRLYVVSGSLQAIGQVRGFSQIKLGKRADCVFEIARKGFQRLRIESRLLQAAETALNILQILGELLELQLLLRRSFLLLGVFIQGCCARSVAEHQTLVPGHEHRA